MNAQQKAAVRMRLEWNGCTDLDRELLAALVDRADSVMLLSDDPEVHGEQVYDALLGFIQDAITGDPVSGEDHQNG